MSRSRPRWGRVYPLACALALLALCPYLVLSTSDQFLMTTLEEGVHSGPLGLSLVDAAANTAFAVGALVSADLAQRRESHRLFLIYAALFVVGAALAGTAPDVWVYGAGRLLMGAAAGLLLIGALPQLIRRYDADHLPTTGLVVNAGLFSATVAGPVIGGLAASAGAWRALFLTLGAIAAAALLLGIPGFESVPAERPGLGVDRRAFALAGAGAALVFFGTGLLVRTTVPRPAIAGAVLLGGLLLVVLLRSEGRRERRWGREPEAGAPDVLVPASLLATSVPVVGTLVASVGGLGSVALIELGEVFVQQIARQAPSRGALLLLPLLGGLAAAGVAYRVVFTTRWVFALIGAGFAALVGGAAVLSVAHPAQATPLLPVVAALVGFGAGATVSPGLFVASLGVPSGQLARTFAAVELVRNEVTFAGVPIFIALAGGAEASLASFHLAVLGVVAVVVLGATITGLVAVTAGMPAGDPQLGTWLDEDGLGLVSPAIGAAAGRNA